jgi:hypothetical protein
MALGKFVAPQGNFIKSTPFNAQAAEGHPLIVIVREFNPEFSTEAYPNKRPVAFVMIADLEPVKAGGAAVLYANALLGGDAVADRLKDYAGAEDEDGNPVKLPVKLGQKASKQGGRKYRTIEPLTGAELALAVAWDEKNPTALQDERARLQAEADAEAAKNEGNGAAPKAGTGTKFDDSALEAAIAGLKS